ncbi:MAG: class I SAM-dependent methyltransferase [Alphaproteobacteria bacterium]|nr:class I SAM-dependent methyltransferase [Alphaproteobacteria bacterium]
MINLSVLKDTTLTKGRKWEHLLLREIVGLAKDYWKDGKDSVGVPKFAALRKKTEPAKAKAASVAVQKKQATTFLDPGWNEDAPHVVEKIWGSGHNLPGRNELVDNLTAPLGLNKEMSVLDLSAGLGGVGRRLADTMDTYVTGLEPDEALAKYGMEISVKFGRAKRASVEFYNPEKFTQDKHFDCVIARELFYRVSNKKRFFKEIKKSIKQQDNPRGQLVFTDYILEAGDKDKPAIKSWLACEKDAQPWSLDEMTKTWTKMGLDVRVNEDLTSMYKREILKSLAAFAEFLKKNPPNSTTKVIVFKEIEKWAMRVAAMESGLKFYRFYAIK